MGNLNELVPYPLDNPVHDSLFRPRTFTLQPLEMAEKMNYLATELNLSIPSFNLSEFVSKFAEEMKIPGGEKKPTFNTASIHIFLFRYFRANYRSFIFCI